MAATLSGASSADCFLAHNFEGYAASGLTRNEIKDDKLTGQEFRIVIDGPDSLVEPSDLECSAFTSKMLICLTEGSESLIVETWLIDVDTATVIFTQTRSNMPIAELNGSKLHRGYLIRPCD